jgi:Domain of unknown function (DUF397)
MMSSGIVIVDETTVRKSSYSEGVNSDCVEAGAGRIVAGEGAGSDVICARDSKNPGGPALTFAPAEWSGFIAEVKAGRRPVNRH